MKRYRLNPEEFFYSNENLDVAVVALDDSPGIEHGYINIRQPTILRPDSRVNIIQHPEGGLKRIAIRDNGLKYYDDNTLQYWTDTDHGSSGSPVFNDNWEIIGLHYRYALSEGESTIIYNESHTITSILSDLDEKFPGRF